MKSSSDFERIIKILDRISAANNECHTEISDCGQLKLMYAITAFSDSVVISLPIYPNAFHGGVFKATHPKFSTTPSFLN